MCPCQNLDQQCMCHSPFIHPLLFVCFFWWFSGNWFRRCPGGVLAKNVFETNFFTCDNVGNEGTSGPPLSKQTTYFPIMYG